MKPPPYNNRLIPTMLETMKDLDDVNLVMKFVQSGILEKSKVIFAIIVLKLGYFPLYNKKPSTGLKITFRRFQSKFPGLKLSQLVPYATVMLSTKFQA